MQKGSVSKNHIRCKYNAKMLSMWFFVLWSFIFLMHHRPIKTIGYVTDVIEI